VSRILVVDDEASIRFVLREALEDAGHSVVEAVDADEARECLGQERFDIAFLDVRMPGESGLDLLSELRAREPGGPVVVIMTALDTFDTAIEAMKRGAFDYLPKPFDLKQVEALVQKAKQLRSLRGEMQELRRQVGNSFRGGEALVGRSATMLETYKLIGRIAPSDAAVLILGESGTGKELVARAIHYHSPRREEPFAAINMTALPSELIEAELFGHERGAFTGASEARAGRFREADGGTLLLDEIGDLSAELQAKLLRVLQQKEVTPLGGKGPIPIDVRILAATHQDLEDRVERKLFREDLYFRLNVVPVRIAPLRERKGDIPLLVHHFVGRFARELNVPERWPTEAAVELLESHAWPGNVRELENVIKRALVLASGDVITPSDIESATGLFRSESRDWTQVARRDYARQLDTGAAPGERGHYWSFVERLEHSIISEALVRSGGNQLQAAGLLGINRNTLRKKISELGIDVS
jgi:two-component system nitrogen regulation response regulator GlnG